MALSSSEFPDVLAAAQSGGEWAVALLYAEHHGALLRYLRAHDPSEADDLSGQVWLEVARGLRSFSGDERGFRGWLFTIARRRLSNERRRRGRRPGVGLDDTLPGVPAVPDPAQQVVDDLAAEDAVRRISALLPPEQADIVLLRIVGGLTVDEVAAAVGRRPGTVRVLQHRALRRLEQQCSRDGVTVSPSPGISE